MFDERFSIPLEPSALEDNSLRFSAFGIDAEERNISAGVAELKLSDLDLSVKPFNAWLYLQDINKVPLKKTLIATLAHSALSYSDRFVCFSRWRDGWLDGWMDGWMYGWMDG